MNLPQQAGLAYAAGAGAQALTNAYGGMVGAGSLANQISPFIGAYAAYKSGSGLSGIVAAAPILLKGLGTQTTSDTGGW